MPSPSCVSPELNKNSGPVHAGHETTAAVLTWTFYLLATHPEVSEKLREEVRVCVYVQSDALALK